MNYPIGLISKFLTLVLSLSPVPLLAQEITNSPSIQASINNFFGLLVGLIAPVLFWTPPLFSIPLILMVMVFGGIFFTFKYGFINIRFFAHAIQVIRGKFDNPDDEGQISHFQALTSALSATVGLGNIAGVAVAISTGGAGAVFWMWIIGFFGMSMKFSSCTLAQMYRRVDDDGTVLGGPMVYLKRAFAQEFNLPTLGKVLGVLFAILTIMASFGGGNLFQANQTYELIASQVPFFKTYPIIVGLILAGFTGVVIIGGITRIGEVTSKLVPAMCLFYVGTCLLIVVMNFKTVPSMFYEIFTHALTPKAAFGGFIGVLIQGIKRASFSNEAGIGSAAIAHAAAKTDEPVREGIVAMIGPTIDTHIVCTMTALAILITGAHLDPTVAGKGALITAKAFESVGSFMPVLLTIATIIFAYSTIISWSYYGEKGAEFLFGKSAIKPYRFIYVIVVIFGPMLSLSNVVDFADLMLLSMAFPNIFGMIFLSGKLKVMIQDYGRRLKAGEMKTYK